MLIYENEMKFYKEKAVQSLKAAEGCLRQKQENINNEKANNYTKIAEGYIHLMYLGDKNK